MRGRRLWCKFEAHGGTVKVYLNKKPLELEGHAVEAFYDPDKGTIDIQWLPSESRLKSTLVHEMLHVCFRGHSGDMREKVLGPKTSNGRHDREEMIVSFLEPVLFDVLTRAGFLKIPRPPKFDAK